MGENTQISHYKHDHLLLVAKTALTSSKKTSEGVLERLVPGMLAIDPLSPLDGACFHQMPSNQILIVIWGVWWLYELLRLFCWLFEPLCKQLIASQMLKRCIKR